MAYSSHLKGCFLPLSLTAFSGHLTQIDRECNGSSELLSKVEKEGAGHFVLIPCARPHITCRPVHLN